MHRANNPANFMCRLGRKFGGLNSWSPYGSPWPLYHHLRKIQWLTQFLRRIKNKNNDNHAHSFAHSKAAQRASLEQGFASSMRRNTEKEPTNWQSILQTCLISSIQVHCLMTAHLYNAGSSFYLTTNGCRSLSASVSYRGGPIRRPPTSVTE